MDLAYFPMDKQRCHLVLESCKYRRNNGCSCAVTLCLHTNTLDIRYVVLSIRKRKRMHYPSVKRMSLSCV